IECGTPWRANEAALVEYRWMSCDYLETLGIPLLKGRLLDRRDGSKAQTVLVNLAMADKFWPGQDAIGKRFGQGSDVSKWYEVVGVVGNVRSLGLARSTPFEFYRTVDESPFNAMTAVIRSPGDGPTS